MKHILHNLWIGAALLLVSSCQDADSVLTPVEPETPQSLVGTPIHFGTTIDKTGAGNTRAAEVMGTGTTMTVGMTVNGVTTYADYTYDGTSWAVSPGSTALTWAGEADHSFIAVSPARDMTNLALTIPGTYTADNVAAYKNLLTTTAATVTKPAPGISLALKHPLVEIVVITKNVQEVKLKGQTLSTTIDAATGSLNAVSHSGATGEITMLKSAENTFTAYILPRTAAEQLGFYSYKDQLFPADTAMPAGSRFVCTEKDKP